VAAVEEGAVGVALERHGVAPVVVSREDTIGAVAVRPGKGWIGMAGNDMISSTRPDG